MQTLLLLQRVIGKPDVHTAFGHHKIGRRDDTHTLGADIDGGTRVNRVLHALQTDPATRVTRQGPTDQSVIEQFLDTCRIQNRDHRINQAVLALVRSGGRFAGVVITHEHEHAAVGMRSGEIAVAEGVTCAVNAGPLAIPDAEYAIVFWLAVETHLLRAPDGGRRNVFIDTGLEYDVVIVQVLACHPELLVVCAERATPVSGDIARGIQPRRLIAKVLHDGQAHQRLGAGDENPAVGDGVLVIERDVTQSHTVEPFVRWAGPCRRRRCAR